MFSHYYKNDNNASIMIFGHTDLGILSCQLEKEYKAMDRYSDCSAV